MGSHIAQSYGSQAFVAMPYASTDHSSIAWSIRMGWGPSRERRRDGHDRLFGAAVTLAEARLKLDAAMGCPRARAEIDRREARAAALRCDCIKADVGALIQEIEHGIRMEEIHRVAGLR